MTTTERVFIFKNRHYRDTFKSLRANGEFCDVTLMCENWSIRAHKSILASASPYFHEVLNGVSTASPIIIINDVRYDDLLAIVTYIYEGMVVLPENQCESFKIVAQMLEIDLTENGAEKREASDTISQDIPEMEHLGMEHLSINEDQSVQGGSTIAHGHCGKVLKYVHSK